jgi:xeroderma pigmentosum group C-complementing protein
MVYVVAFEEDGYARDVTPRYAKEYGAKVSKMRQGGKGKKEWWEHVLRMFTRPYRLVGQLFFSHGNISNLVRNTRIVMTLKMMSSVLINSQSRCLRLWPDSRTIHCKSTDRTMLGSCICSRKGRYVLERHLKRDEVIHPLVELGKFRGEPVYSRSSVLSLKTAENWMRQGRKVREGCQPMKWVKQNAVTVNKRRAIEMAMSERQDRLSIAGEDQGAGFSSEKDVMQSLYAENQTELYIPDPVIDVCTLSSLPSNLPTNLQNPG